MCILYYNYNKLKQYIIVPIHCLCAQKVRMNTFFIEAILDDSYATTGLQLTEWYSHWVCYVDSLLFHTI